MQIGREELDMFMGLPRLTDKQARRAHGGPKPTKYERMQREVRREEKRLKKLQVVLEEKRAKLASYDPDDEDDLRPRRLVRQKGLAPRTMERFVNMLNEESKSEAENSDNEILTADQ